jgi:3-hydroxyisobutyrate dehydrogenase
MTQRLVDGGPILFVGIGAMGEPMAMNLARAGFDVILSDVAFDRVAELAERIGARAVAEHARGDVLVDVKTVILMLPSSPIVESVLTGTGGIFEALTPGSVVIDMSSSTPASTRRLAALAVDRDLALIDAPVSGGVPKARTGELAIMVGGNSGVVESRRDVLETLGAVVTHVGESGAGHAMKALNNLLSGIGMVAAAEVLAIAKGFGIEPRVALDVINASTGRNQATEVKYGRYILSRAFDSGFAMALMVKDLRTALDLAHDAQIPVPMSASALEEWTAAIAELGKQADHTEIAEYVERRAGVELTESAAAYEAAQNIGR